MKSESTKKTKTTRLTINRPKKNLNRGYDFTTARLMGRLDAIHAVCDNILFARIIDEFRNVK